MKKQETAPGRPPRLPEVAVTLQEDSSITGKIKLSVEGELALLSERNRQLETENAILREREAALVRDDVETLNQRRGEAIAAHAQKTGKASIKSTEAGTVLETVEGRKLDRKTVHRALDVARGILRASSEVVGGIRRLVIPSPSPGGGEDRPQPVVGGGGGYRGGVSRPRRWAVPWDGVD